MDELISKIEDMNEKELNEFILLVLQLLNQQSG
jgi:hypothetical protein